MSIIFKNSGRGQMSSFGSFLPAMYVIPGPGKSIDNFRHKNYTKNCLYSLWIAFINRLRSISQPIAFSLRSEWAHYVKWRDESEDVAQWPIVMLSGPIVSLSLPTCEPQHPICLSHVFCLNTNHVICSSLAATLLHKYRPKYQNHFPRS